MVGKNGGFDKFHILSIRQSRSNCKPCSSVFSYGICTRKKRDNGREINAVRTKAEFLSAVHLPFLIKNRDFSGLKSRLTYDEGFVMNTGTPPHSSFNPIMLRVCLCCGALVTLVSFLQWFCFDSLPTASLSILF
jgi:hypothetical protein